MKDILAAALAHVEAALAHGDSKYGENQWAKNEKPDAVNLQDHIQATQRHLTRFRNGEPIDESGHPALAHVAARALLALYFDERIRMDSIRKSRNIAYFGDLLNEMEGACGAGALSGKMNAARGALMSAYVAALEGTVQ